MSNKEYIVYYSEPGLSSNDEYFRPNDPERIQPIHGSGHGHGHEIQPSHGNHMIQHNNTAINDYDFSYVVINVVFNLFCLLVFVELFKRCYIRCMIINQPQNRRRLLIEEERVNYTHNTVVIRENIKEEVCSICLEELFPEDVENSNQVIELKCNHMFHKECLDPWVINNKCCPLCKRNT